MSAGAACCKGLAAGGLVLAAQFPPCATRSPIATGADKMPNGDGERSAHLRVDRARRHRHHRGGARRDGHRRRAHHAAADRCRRARSRLGEGAHQAVAGRREEIRQPGHRRLAQRAALPPADAAVRRLRAHDAGAGRGQALGRRGRPRSRRRTTRSCTRPSGRKLGYGEVAAEAAALPTPAADQVQLKDPSAFRYIGKGNVPVVDLFDITTGHAMYGQDVRLDGMKYAVVARPPVVGGKVASFDATETMKVPGVEKVVKLDGTPAPSKFNPLGGVAVIAKNTWAALKGRDALKIVWDDGPNKSYDSKAYKAMLEEQVRKPGKLERQRRRCRCGAEVRRARHHGGVLRAASRARHDGAAGRGRAPAERQVGGVGAGAEPGRRARRHRQGARHQAGGDGGAHARCSAAASGASRSATSRSRRRGCRARSAARR